MYFFMGKHKCMAPVALNFIRASLTPSALNWTLGPCDFGKGGSLTLLGVRQKALNSFHPRFYTSCSIKAILSILSFFQHWFLSSCEIFYKRSNFLWKISKVRQLPRRPGIPDVSIVVNSDDQRAIQAVRREGHVSDCGFRCLFRCWDGSHVAGSKACIQLFLSSLNDAIVITTHNDGLKKLPQGNG